MRTNDPSAVEVIFRMTPDGLVVDRCILKPARASHEADLRRFAHRVLHGVAGVAVLCDPAGGEP